MPTQGQDALATGAAPSKAYSLDDTGNLAFQPGRLADGLLAAHQDGALDSDKIKTLLPKAIDADKAFTDQQALQQRVSVDDYAKAKARLSGLVAGGSQVAGGIEGASIGSDIGGVAGGGLAAFLGPEAIPAGVFAGKFLGGGAGALIGSHLAGGAESALATELAKHSDTIKSFTDASQALPQYDQQGRLAAFVLAGGAGLTNLARVGAMRAAQQGIGAAFSATAKEAGLAALGGAGVEAAVRPSLDWVVNQGKTALGITPQADAVQSPTAQSILNAAVLGVALNELGTKFEGYDTQDIGNLYRARQANQPLTPAQDSALNAAQAAVDAGLKSGKTFFTKDFGFKVQQALSRGTVRAQSVDVTGQGLPPGPTALGGPAPAPPSAGPLLLQGQTPSPSGDSPPSPVAPSPTAPDGSAPTPQTGGPSPATPGGVPALPLAPAAPAGSAASSPASSASSPSIPGVAGGQAAVPAAGDTFINGGVRYAVTAATPDTVSIRPETAPAAAPPLQIPRAHIDDQLTSGASQLEKAPAAPAAAAPAPPASTTPAESLQPPRTAAGVASPAPPADGTSPGEEVVSPRQEPTTATAPDNEPNPNLPETRPAPPPAAAQAPQAPAATVDPGERPGIPGLDLPTEDRAPAVRPAAGSPAAAAGDAGADAASPARQPDGLVADSSSTAAPKVTGIPAVPLPSNPNDDKEKGSPDAQPTTQSQPAGTSGNDRTLPADAAQPGVPGGDQPQSSGAQSAGGSGSSEQPVARAARSDPRNAPAEFSPERATSAIEQAHAQRTAGIDNAPPLRARTFAAPARVAAPRQTEVRLAPNDSGTGTKEIPPDSDRVAAAREWLADQRSLGHHPSPGDVTRAQKIPPVTAKRLIDDQVNAEHAAAEQAQGSGIKFNRATREVEYDPQVLARSMRNVAASGGNPEAWVHSTVSEEMHHDADVVASDSAGGYDAVHDEIYDALPKANRQAMQKAYGDLPPAPHLSGQEATDYQHRALAAEYVRALAQRRAGEPITESHFTDTKALEALLDGPQPPAVEAQMARMARLTPAAMAPQAGGRAANSLASETPSNTSSGSPTQSPQRTSGRHASLGAAGEDSGSESPALGQSQAESVASLSPEQTPTAPAKQPRSFTLPDAPNGHSDVIDHIREQGGMVSRAQAAKRDTFTKYAGDYDGAPDLRGIYHQHVFGGKLMPDQMAETLHQNYGVGDGTPDGMWNAIGKSISLRQKIRAQYKANAEREQQTARFDKDTAQKKKGSKTVHVGNLNVGDVLTVHGEKLKVIDLDPDTLDVTLQDHSRYGVQKVDGDGVLYVEQVKKAPTNAAFAPEPAGAKTPAAPGRPTAPPLDAPEPVSAPASAQHQDSPPVPSPDGASPARSADAPDSPESSPQPQTTIKGLVGKPINARRTAFAPAADSLGIPRDQMPQVAAEHRGALANFLQGRGISWQNADVLPSSLKPSQADFNPGKVEKARDWVGDSDRRILISSDNRVIDGHHQWMARLHDHPNEPMPVVRLDAPARDILSQIHEFPSAGMESAPDIEPVADAPDFNLESPTGDQLNAETEKRRQREAIADRQARKLTGKEIDTTGDLLDPTAADNPLFSQGLGAAIPPQSRAQVAEKGDDYRELPAENATVAGPATFTLAAAKPLVAFHGTPHEVDRFSSEKIGTGEGAQVYGHGLYFAENRGVADSYRTAGMDQSAHAARRAEVLRSNLGTDAERFAQDQIVESQRQYDALRLGKEPVTATEIEKARNWVKFATDTLRYLRTPRERWQEKLGLPGNLYNVHLNAELDELVDWDQPLGAGTPAAQGIARALDANPAVAARFPNRAQMMRGGEMTGEAAYQTFRMVLGSPQKASDALRDAGVPGIRYLDQGSRNASDAGQGTSNYVMFDDSRIKITHRNGQPVSMAEVATPSHTLAAARPVPGMKLREAGKDFPRDETEPKLLDVSAPNAVVVARAAREFQSWPASVQAADGSTITLHNRERGSLGTRVKHLMFDNENERLMPNKAEWLPAVPDTLRHAAVRVVDPENGNRIYAREYRNGTKHMVVVRPDGTVADQKPFTGSLVTQFPITEGLGRRGEMQIDWVRPEGERTGLPQPASGPTPAGSNEGTVSPRPAFQGDVIPRKPGGQGADDSSTRLAAAVPPARDTGADNAVDEPSTWAKVTEALAHLTSKEGAVGSAIDDIAKVFVPAARGEHAKLTAEALQEVTAQMARNQVQQAAVLKGMRTMVARMPAADQRSLLFDLDEGKAPANPDLAAAFDQFRKLDADRLDSMKETLKRYGVNDLDDFNRYADTIIPHLFKDPDRAEQVFSAMEKKMSGGTGFLKPRSQYTYRELARFGLEPKTNNFVDLAAARWWMQERFLGALQLADEMEKAGTGHWETGDYTPKADEEEIGHRLLSKTGQKEGKPRRLKFFAREEAARPVKNYLSEGLRGKPWFQAYLAAANRLNGAQLGLSFFHGGFITTESVTSQLANAIHMAAHGDFAGAVKAAAKAPISPILDYKLGSKLVGEWNKPGSQGEAMGNLLRHIISGGGRGNMDSIYNENDTEKFLDALRSKAYATAALRAPFAAVEQLARPIMEKYVPNLKMAATAKMIQAKLAQNPNATPVQMRSMAAEAVRSTNNRFGQMTYDNLHLHKTVKDILMGMTRSLGWNWGTFAEIGGGVKDLLKAGIDIAPKITFGAGGRGSGGDAGGGGGGGKGPGGTDEEPLFSAGGVNVFKGKTPQFTQKMAYVLALPLVAGIMGAALNAAFGQKAEQLKDYYFPKTGDKDAKGRPIRLSLPTYMKDVFAFADSPTTTITNKLHPLLSMIAQMYENKDFYGTEIRHQDDPYMKQIIQELKFVGGNLLPFTITNLAKTSQDGASPLIKALGFVGFGKAAARIGETDAEKLADSLVIDRMPQGTRTQAQANKSQLKGTILNAARQGNLSPLRAAVNAKLLTPQEARTIETRARLTPLQDRVHSLGLEDAEKVLAVATPAEKQELALVMEAKYAAARKAGRPGSQAA